MKDRHVLTTLLPALMWVLAGCNSSTTTRTVVPLEQQSRMNHRVNAQSAAKRALCLASLVVRARAEYELHPEPGDTPNPNGPVAPDFVANQVAWMKSEGLWEAASVHERALLQKPLGKWERQEVADGQWREEDLLVLMWALQPGTDLPPYDQMMSESDFDRLVPAPSAAQAFIAKAKLRDVQEISKARDVAELWLWRARTTQLQRDHVTPPKGMTFEEIIRTAAAHAEKDRLFTAIDHDFPALGRSYAKLSETQWYTMRSIATERLYVLNWLCGYSKDWDAVPTDT